MSHAVEDARRMRAGLPPATPADYTGVAGIF
jgi:hypothetical protein